MNSTYAFAITRLYQAIHKGDTSTDIRTLYKIVYPMIFSHARKGESRCSTTAAMTSGIVARLVKEGYLVMHDNDRWMIDWQNRETILRRSPLSAQGSEDLPVVPERDVDAEPAHRTQGAPLAEPNPLNLSDHSFIS